MKKYIFIGLILAAQYAFACTTQTVLVGGKMLVCTTCGSVTTCM
ncbi:hypothetical protein MCEZE4_00152 [Burkholderiaceae bacterium]|jgi:hypothetical protein